MVLHGGARCVDALRAFNVLHPSITIHTFKALAGIMDPNLYTVIIDYMESAKATVPGLTKVVSTQQRQQWYNWQVMHPGLSESQVHPSRRMHSH